MQKSFDGLAATTFLVFTVILGSIGFISLQGYSADARNSKRASDINTIQSAMSTQLAQGQSILSFVIGNKDNKIDPKILSLGGKKETTIADYDAGSVNYAALPIRAEDFLDPTFNIPYAIGVTSRDYGKYEVSTIIENVDGKNAKVVGTYLMRSSKEIFCSKVEGNDNQISIRSIYVNLLSLGDYVTVKIDNGEIKTKIKAISVDGTKITLNDKVTNPTKIQLSESESIGLIDQRDDDGKSGDNFVTDGGMNLPY